VTSAIAVPVDAPAVSVDAVLVPRDRQWGAPIAGAVLGILVLLAALANVVAPYGFDVVDLAHRRAIPSAAHWFGTDELGRDLLTRIIFGARISLSIGIISAAMSAAIGVTVGALAGFAGRWIDDVLMGWMETARVVRADVQSIKTRDYVTAARALGASPLRLVLRHLLPGALPAATVATTIAVGRGILLESALSFFGVGVQPPTASWGNMLYQAQTTMTTEPWLGIFPGVFIFVTVLCFNVLGDTLSRRA